MTRRFRTLLVLPWAFGSTAFAGPPEQIYVAAGDSIQSAMDLVDEGGLITLGPGVHDAGKTLDFKGKPMTIAGARGFDATLPPTVIVSSISGGPVFLIEANPGASLKNLAITNGSGTTGGAVRVEGSEAFFHQVDFTDNTALTGGALYVDNRSGPVIHPVVTILECAFSGNSGELGGAIFASLPPTKGSPAMVVGDSIIQDNSAAQIGGGVYLPSGSTIALSATIVCGNAGGQISGSGVWTDSPDQPSCVDVHCIDYQQDGITDSCSDTDCPGDRNGDGMVDGFEFGVLLGSWGLCEGCPADYNEDGRVDGIDMGVLLGLWGDCFADQ